MEREVALWWPERRTMLEVARHDAALDFAWQDLVRVYLQLDPIPQYVVLTNQRDLHLSDLARDRKAPRLAIRIDDLPKYSEAFPFFTTDWVPGATPRIANVEKVSEEVADLVARLYRSVRGPLPSAYPRLVILASAKLCAQAGLAPLPLMEQMPDELPWGDLLDRDRLVWIGQVIDRPSR